MQERMQLLGILRVIG